MNLPCLHPLSPCASRTGAFPILLRRSKGFLLGLLALQERSSSSLLGRKGTPSAGRPLRSFPDSTRIGLSRIDGRETPAQWLGNFRAWFRFFHDLSVCMFLSFSSFARQCAGLSTCLLTPAFFLPNRVCSRETCPFLEKQGERRILPQWNGSAPLPPSLFSSIADRKPVPFFPPPMGDECMDVHFWIRSSSISK